MYLGIDLGTSGVKVLLIDEAQAIIASQTAPLAVQRPKPGWSEQEADDWITATEAAMSGLCKCHGAEVAQVRGIGLSGQMHGATLVDTDGKAIRPCILWNDTRSHGEAAELDSDPDFRAISGNIVFPGFTAPKLVWAQRNEPRHFERTAKVLLPKDFLRLWLTGECASEMSDAAGTSWLDVGKRGWSSKLLSKSGMAASQMPSLVEGSQSSGKLRAALAERWGMNLAPVVAGGAGDNAASAIGMGVIKDGDAFVSLGTSGVLFVANDGFRPNANSAVHAFCHALPERWHQMGVILSATDSLEWLSRLTGQTAQALSDGLGETLRAPGTEIFLPYLSGERTPHNEAEPRGAFSNLSHLSDTKVLSHAVMAGVAFALKDNLAALNKAGTNLKAVTAIGGGSRSAYWLKLIATVLNIPVHVAKDGDFGAAFGAARLGMMAAENSDPAGIATAPEIAFTHLPDTALTDAYEAAHQRFAALYPAIRTI